MVTRDIPDSQVLQVTVAIPVSQVHRDTAVFQVHRDILVSQDGVGILGTRGVESVVILGSQVILDSPVHQATVDFLVLPDIVVTQAKADIQAKADGVVIRDIQGSQVIQDSLDQVDIQAIVDSVDLPDTQGFLAHLDTVDTQDSPGSQVIQEVV